MIDFHQRRLLHHPVQGTISLLRVGTFHCWIMECPWKDNKPYVSCIPPGDYKLEHAIYTNKSGDQFSTLEILDIPGGRWGCKYHPANFASQLEGCQAPGLAASLVTKWAVHHSQMAFDQLMLEVSSYRNQPMRLLISESFHSEVPDPPAPLQA